MAPSSGVWAPIAMRLLRQTVKKTSELIQKRVAEAAQRAGSTQPVPVLVRNAPKHPISKAAWLRQRQSGRWYTTHSAINAGIKRFMSSIPAQAARIDRSAFPKSAVGSAVLRSTVRAPFAHTLRPNLTGGALPRTAGGYSLGGGRVGGARYFSHTPAAPAQVVNNVSQAVRAFLLSGQKAQFDGCTARGEKRFRAVSTAQDKATKKMQSSFSKFAPGSYVDFKINPTVTALSPLAASFPFSAKMKKEYPTLNTDGLLDVLSVDFSRALKDFAAIMNDLKRLSALGDLAVTLEDQSTLRVRFPGCDAELVERLCHEVGVQRGVIYQDTDFDETYGGETALLFPYAESTAHTPTSPSFSIRSRDGDGFEEVEDYAGMEDVFLDNPWLSSPDGYATMEEISDTESLYFSRCTPSASNSGGYSASNDASYVEGIRQFLTTVDSAGVGA